MRNTIGTVRTPIDPPPRSKPLDVKPGSRPVVATPQFGYSSRSTFEPMARQAGPAMPPANQSCGGPTDPNAGYGGQNLSRADLFTLTDQAAAENDLPPEVMRAVALQESGGIQWTSDGSVVENDNANGTTDWGVMQLNTEGWLGNSLDVNRAKSDERYNVSMSAKELRTAADYWFPRKYGHEFTMQWYNSLPPDQQKEARIDLFRSYNGWLPDTSNADPYESKIDSGAIGTVPSSGTGSASGTGRTSDGSALQAPSSNLTRGDSGPQVELLQKDLVKLGYMTQAQMDTGPGIFGPRTQAAVQKLQRATGVTPSAGDYGPKTRAALTRALAPKSESTPEAPSASAVPSSNLKYGDDNAQVKQLQTDLVSLGYMTQAQMDTGPGTFGPRTKAALAQFQHDAGYPDADGGGYGPKTRKALGKALEVAKKVPSSNLKYGDDNAQVKQLQTDLVKLGYMTQAQMDTGPGTFGPRTQAALAQLQHDAGYPASDGSSYGPQARAALVHALVSGHAPNSTPTTPTAPSVPATPGGAITSVSQANAFFTTQWAGFSGYNTETSESYGYSDCGPTSTLMIASSLGLIAPPEPGTAEDQIDHMRDLALGYDTTWSQGTNEGQMANAISQLGGHSQYLDQSIGEVDQALASGQRVLIAGDPWGAWGASMDSNGQYLNHRDPGAHFVAILGKTSDGQYIVADPLSGVGAITVSASQIQEFWREGGGESGAMAVGA